MICLDIPYMLKNVINILLSYVKRSDHLWVVLFHILPLFLVKLLDRNLDHPKSLLRLASPASRFVEKLSHDPPFFDGLWIF